MQAQELVLRDVHVPAPPPLWPPAPGWWLLVAAALSVCVVLWWIQRRRRLKKEGWQKLFDEACASDSSAAQVAGMSELLRRAARRTHANADRLQGDDWLRFLDGENSRDFSAGSGRLLLEGGYRREVEAAELSALRTLAGERFFELMAKRR